MLLLAQLLQGITLKLGGPPYTTPIVHLFNCQGNQSCTQTESNNDIQCAQVHSITMKIIKILGAVGNAGTADYTQKLVTLIA